jgi:hypothetical protein
VDGEKKRLPESIFTTGSEPPWNEISEGLFEFCEKKPAGFEAKFKGTYASPHKLKIPFIV